MYTCRDKGDRKAQPANLAKLVRVLASPDPFATQLHPLFLVTSPFPCLLPSFLLLCLPCLCNCLIIAFLLSSKGGPMFF